MSSDLPPMGYEDLQPGTSVMFDLGNAIDIVEVGDSVLYVPAPGQVRAAVVTRVWPNSVVNLNVHNDMDEDVRLGKVQPVYAVTSVPYDEEGRAGTWNWGD